MMFLAPDPTMGNFSFGIKAPSPEGWELPVWMSANRHTNYVEAVHLWASLLKALGGSSGEGSANTLLEVSDEDRMLIEAPIINTGICGGMQVRAGGIHAWG